METENIFPVALKENASYEHLQDKNILIINDALYLLEYLSKKYTFFL